MSEIKEIIVPVTQYWPYLIGPFGGFLAFLMGVGTMENVLWRTDADGISKFRYENFIEFIKLPFDTQNWKQNWGLLSDISISTRLKLLNLNWVAMVGIGSLLSFGLYYYGNYI